MPLDQHAHGKGHQRVNEVISNTKSFPDASAPDAVGDHKMIVNDNHNHANTGDPLTNNNNNLLKSGSIVNNNYNNDDGVGADFNNNNNNIILREGSIVNNNYNEIGGPTSSFNNNNNNFNFRGAVFNNNDNGVKMVRFGTNVKSKGDSNMHNMNSNVGMVGAYHNMDYEVPSGYGKSYMNKNMNDGGVGSVFNGNNL